MKMPHLIRPDSEKKTLKYYSLQSSTKADVTSSFEFFFIGTDKKIVNLLLENFRSGFCSEDIPKASQILNMLTTRKINLPDVIIVQNNFHIDELNTFLQIWTHRISNIPVIIEGSSQLASFQPFHQSIYVDDIFIITDDTIKQLVKKVEFLRKVKAKGASEHARSSRPQTGEILRAVNKKTFDFLVALISIIILSPILLIIAAIIKLESRGPVFYCSPRVGRGYQVFNFYKFRTMEDGADQKLNELYHLNQYNATEHNSPVFFKVSNDPRVTRFGALLRNTSLDELPQLFNVLKGDMSIVGNRPLPLYEAETLTTDQWAERFLAPAGITGLWQIRKRGNRNMSVEERISLDIAYAKNNNIVYDLWIMANTPSALIQKDNV